MVVVSKYIWVFVFVCFALFATAQDNKNSISYILIDGLSADVFARLRDQGKLPTMDSLARSGVFTENGIVSFPSMTGYSFYPFLTGMDAAESGIFGLRWFDRSLDEGNLRNYVGRTNIYMNEDIRKDVPTIFELFSDQYSVSINSFLNRGVTKSVKKGWMLTTAKYGSNKHFGKLRNLPVVGAAISRNLIEHELIIADLAVKQLQDDPKVHWITFAAPDASQHTDGLDDLYDSLLVQIDSLVGKYIDTYKQLGQTDRHIAIISDHGVADVTTNINPVHRLKEDLDLVLQRGQATELWKGRLDRPLTELEHSDGYFVVNGNLTAFVYMTDPSLSFPENWRKRNYNKALEKYGKSETHLLEYFANLEGVELTISSIAIDEHIVYSQQHKATLKHKDGQYAYNCTTEEDPLNYSQYQAVKPLINSGFHPDSVWRLATANTEYPDALYRLHGLMHHDDSPDIVLCSKGGYDFGKDYEIFVDNYKGGHGGLHRSMISVPFILSGSTIKPKTYETLRNEEVGQMILDLMGVPIVKIDKK